MPRERNLPSHRSHLARTSPFDFDPIAQFSHFCVGLKGEREAVLEGVSVGNGYRRMLIIRFLFSASFEITDDTARMWAVLDIRSYPKGVRVVLSRRSG